MQQGLIILTLIGFVFTRVNSLSIYETKRQGLREQLFKRKTAQTEATDQNANKKTRTAVVHLTKKTGRNNVDSQTGVTSSISPHVRLGLGSVRVRVVTEPNPN